MRGCEYVDWHGLSRTPTRAITDFNTGYHGPQRGLSRTEIHAKFLKKHADLGL